MKPFRIVQLSDSHFGTVRPGVAEGLLQTIHDLAPDLIIFSGDITQRARHEQFAEARRFVDRLPPAPLIAVPGNHDIPLFNIFGRVFLPYANFKRLFKSEVEKDFDNGDISVIGLNSTSRWRHIQGRLEIDRLRHRLTKAHQPRSFRIAAFHHPMDCGRAPDDKNLLRGRNKIMPIFAEHHIDLILGGHIHDPFVTLSTRRYPQLSRSMVIGVAGTCTSWRTRADAPNSFNLIELERREVSQMRVSRYDQRTDLNFTVESARVFCRSLSGWIAAES